MLYNGGPNLNDEIYIGFDFDSPSTIYDCIISWDLGALKGCYIDEHTENHSLEESTQLLGLVDNHFISKFGNNSIIVVGDRNERLVDYNDHLAEYVNYTHWTDYHYYGPFPTTYFYGEEDQSDAWQDFNDSFGSNFDNLWVYNEDQNELYTLIQFSKDRGKNSFWLYQPTWNTIYIFCLVAWQKEYLYRTDRKYNFEYTYIGNSDPCTDETENYWV